MAEEDRGTVPQPTPTDTVGTPTLFDSGRGAVPTATPSPVVPPVTVKASDAAAIGVAEARAQSAAIRLQPVEAMLRDPLGEVARKERRSLLGISAIAILVGWTGLVPARIENFGIAFAPPERQALLWVFIAVVGYYTFAFVIYSISDALSWGYAMHRGREELRKQGQDVAASTPAKAGEPWRFVNFVTPASLARGLFDFGVPVVVALFAIWSLWGAVHQVTPKGPATPTTPEAVPTPGGTGVPPTGK